VRRTSTKGSKRLPVKGKSSKSTTKARLSASKVSKTQKKASKKSKKISKKAIKTKSNRNRSGRRVNSASPSGGSSSSGRGSSIGSPAYQGTGSPSSNSGSTFEAAADDEACILDDWNCFDNATSLEDYYGEIFLAFIIDH